MLLGRDASDVEALYNVAVSLQFLGKVQESADAYFACLTHAPLHVEARINLAALFHRHGSVRDGLGHYEEALEALRVSGRGPAEIADSSVMIWNNLGVARTQLGLFEESVEAHEDAAAGHAARLARAAEHVRERDLLARVDRG